MQELILARKVRIMIDEQEYPFNMDGSLGFMDFLGMHNQRYGLMDAKFYEVREDDLRQGGYPTDQENRDFIRMMGAVGTMTCYRVLFTTEKYMGLAPLTARIGDIIFLLPGADVPFVLRHVEDEEYEVVGQCYTHGIMYGERADTGLLQSVTLV